MSMRVVSTSLNGHPSIANGPFHAITNKRKQME